MVMKCAICAIAKNENNYIKEWVEYHLRLGFAHIYIYDNNDVDGEKISEVINNKNVTIIDYRGLKGMQTKSYTSCFNDYKHLYDFMLFIDIDEFLVFEDKNMNVSEFLSLKQFSNQNVIRLNWMHFTDNNQLDIVNNDYSVFNRFKERIPYTKDCFGKSFVRTNVTPKGGISAHGYCPQNFDVPAVNALGKPCKNHGCVVSDKPLYKIAWVNHYRTKTIGEYIRQKYYRGDASVDYENNRYNNLTYFFDTNSRNKQKIEYANRLLDGK